MRQLKAMLVPYPADEMMCCVTGFPQSRNTATAIAAPPNSISSQLPEPLPTARALRAISRSRTLIWPGAGGGEVS
jgi:hypothetical protein